MVLAVEKMLRCRCGCGLSCMFVGSWKPGARAVSVSAKRLMLCGCDQSAAMLLAPIAVGQQTPQVWGAQEGLS